MNSTKINKRILYYISHVLSCANTHTHTHSPCPVVLWVCGGRAELQTTGYGPPYYYYVRYRMINHKWTFTVFPRERHSWRGSYFIFNRKPQISVVYIPVCVCVCSRSVCSAPRGTAVDGSLILLLKVRLQ